MYFISILLLNFLAANFAEAGATHGWCTFKKLPKIAVCNDQRGSYFQESEDELQHFKFSHYGEDRSTEFLSLESSQFVLMRTDWGRYTFLIDSNGEKYELKCGTHQQGLCTAFTRP